MTKLTQETEDVVAGLLQGVTPKLAKELPDTASSRCQRGADLIQSLSDRIDRLEAQLTLLAGIEDAPPQRTGPAEYGDDRLPQKIWDKIEVREDGCWLWHGRMGTHGYGQISGSYQSHNAHRYIYAALIDRVPNDMVCDHLCRNRLCVNPAHIEVVTNAENVRRGNVLRTGNQSSSRKLSEEDVKIIYSHKGQHGMGTKLSQRFRINQGTIYKIWSGEHWASVTGAVRQPSLIKEGGR